MSQKPPKKLVHGTLIDVEILTSPVPQVFAQPGQDLDTDALPVAVQALPKWSKMFLCVSANSTKFGAWGLNRCWDIDFPTPPCICLTWPSYQVTMLHPLVCQNLPGGLKMFLCVLETSKNLGDWALIDAEILTSPLFHVFAQLGPVIQSHCFSCGCVNTSQVV